MGRVETSYALRRKATRLKAGLLYSTWGPSGLSLEHTRLKVVWKFNNFNCMAYIRKGGKGGGGDQERGRGPRQQHTGGRNRYKVPNNKVPNHKIPNAQSS